MQTWVTRYVADLYKHGNNSVNVPTLVGTVFLSGHEGIGGDERLELWLGHVEEGQHLFHDGPDVVLVYESEGELECPATD